jgi:hypothetical protein
LATQTSFNKNVNGVAQGEQMSVLLRPKCWLTRHHWLLQYEKPTAIYEDNELVAESEYHYQCQVCGKWSKQDVINLDNAPIEE